MSNRLPSRVLLLPEYGVDLPLWDRTSRGIGTFDENELGISDQLAARLRTWNAQWESHPPEKPRRWSAKEANRWRETGYRLAGQLQSELPEIDILIVNEQGREVLVSEAWRRQPPLPA